jgi:hypothetical protein
MDNETRPNRLLSLLERILSVTPTLFIINKPTYIRGWLNIDGITIYTGNGSPENVIAANVGSMYLRKDGGSGTTLYVKEAGTGNTGWSTTA